ncbi:MAG TPA: hypothetical protein VNX88_23540 [Terriglobales bacterium]|jgi:hypothetical protein|nr:hypothetical protein [Terriglobales bacterium]
MSESVSRRRFLAVSSLTVPAMAIGLHSRSAPAKSDSGQGAKSSSGVAAPGELYPAEPPELARETVLVSHFNLARVKELVAAHPSLAKASWDWGFGDWETALGAASHMGNRAIAEFLLANGAHPSIFSATMLGQVDVVKAFITAQPGIQRTRGPHSISLLAHAKAGGDASRPVFEFLQSLGDADAPAEAPLGDQERAAILGTYIFGPSPTQQVDVTVEKGKLTWTRQGTMGRGLFHLGEQVFHPSGAPAVRIRFTQDAGVRTMTVNDPDVVLVGKMSRTPGV